jgi:hypothetical protein
MYCLYIAVSHRGYVMHMGGSYGREEEEEEGRSFVLCVVREEEAKREILLRPQNLSVSQ